MTLTRRHLLAAAAAATPLLAAAAPPAPPVPPTPTAAAELRALLDASAAEWSRGDIDAFCSHYHDDAVFVSPSGLTRGRQAVLDRYKKKYASKALMGALSFDVLDVNAGADAGSIAMRWKLTYPDKAAAEGFSVIGLVKAGARWLIKHDASM